VSAPTLTVVFMADNSLVGRAIRWFTASPVSHVALCAEFAGVRVLVHATVGGVQVTRRSTFLRKHRIVAEFYPKHPNALSLREAVDRIGERYDYAGLFGFLVVLLGRRLGKRIANPLASSHATVCSELVVRAALRSGTLKSVCKLSPASSTPFDVLLAMRSEVEVGLVSAVGD